MVAAKKKERMENIIEDIDESGDFFRPFDPNEVKIYTPAMTVQTIIERLEYDEINLFTEFQRNPNLWDNKKQSRLIESILLNMPLPSFYFDGEEDNKWQVVDGLQRISTIKNFIVDKTLTLENLEFLPQFNGKKYDDFSRDMQRRIKSFPITGYVIQEGTPDDVKYILFSRINTESLILTPQEIRHALNQGKPAIFIEELANLISFKKATDFSINSIRMQDRDFANRFVSFYLLKHENYQPDLNSFLNLGMSRLKSKSEEDLKKIKNAFSQANELAILIFKKDAYRKRVNSTDRRKPINKSLFDAISVNLAKLSKKEVEKIKLKKGIVNAKLRVLMKTDEEFMASISSSTGQKDKVKTRYNKIHNLLEEILNK